MDDELIDARYTQLQYKFVSFLSHPKLEWPLSSWVQPHDRHFPQKVLSRTLREVLQRSSWEQIRETPGVGQGKLWKILDLVERAEREFRQGTTPQQSRETVPLPPAPASFWRFDPDAVGETEWCGWCDVIRRHRLDAHPLGRFARALSEVPQGLWHVPLRAFADQSLADAASAPGYGPARFRHVLVVIADMAQALSGAPANGHLFGRLLTNHLHSVAVWIDEILAADVAPNLNDVVHRFLEPLLSQFVLDLGESCTALIRRRWGASGPSATLDELAKELGLTKERVRQLTSKAADVMAVRWPEGKHLLDDLFELVQGTAGADAQLDFVRTVLDACYDVPLARSGSRADVTSAWERAGRNKLTPMTADELRRWLASEFPELSPEAAQRWLREDGLVGTSVAGHELYFSRDSLDALLHHLMELREPLGMTDVLEFVTGDERNVRTRLDRDPRFIEDEYRRVMASEHCSFFRQDGVWQVRLDTGARPKPDSLPVQHLAHLVIGGMLQAGVADATVWGVRRYADWALASVYGCRLPAGVTAFILASMFTRLSDGLIRHMRRRRLRWDSGEGIAIRGKRGWMNHVVSQAGTPITFEELRSGLRAYFQDYEDYVFSQMTNEEEEDGGDKMHFRIIPGLSTRIPRLYVPDNWSLNAERTNVSDGVRRFVARVVAANGEFRFARTEFDQAPWLVTLCEHEAYGNMQWADRPPPITADEQQPEESRGESEHQNDVPSTSQTTAADGHYPDKLADLMNRFL